MGRRVSHRRPTSAQERPREPTELAVHGAFNRRNPVPLRANRSPSCNYDVFSAVIQVARLARAFLIARLSG